MSELLLVEQCKQQNRKAQMALYRQYCDGMFIVAHRYMKDEAAAEDALQEAFIKAFRKLDQFKGDVTFGAWLKRIVVNTCLDALKANKTIIFRMPKSTKTEVNVRYGELKMVNAYNLKATLNYSTLTANSIDGGQTRIDASYAPVFVNQWKQGALYINFVEDCRLNTVSEINLQSNNSDVTINDFQKKGKLAGSFGNLYILKVSPEFQYIDIVLDNTDATLNLPNTAFDFVFNGNKSTFKYPKSLQLEHTKKGERVSAKGFNKTKNAERVFTINAAYSNLSLQ